METNNTDLSSLKINRTEKQNPSGTYNKLFKMVAIISFIAILIIVGYLILNPLLKSRIEVKLTEAVLQSPSLSITELIASGYVVAQRKAAVASKGTGRLVYLGVVEGDKVKKGEIIAKLEDSDVKAQLEAAEANLELSKSGLKNAEDTYKREKTLFKTGSASQADLDASEANYKQILASIDISKANVNAAKVAVEYTIIRAPFDGTVLTKDADVGEIVAPFGASINSKGAVVTIADMKSLQVEADVSESNIEKISPNQNCEIVLDAYPDYNYPGYVSKIVPTADRTKATVMVKVAFKKYDSRVLPEMSAKVMFLTKSNKQTNANQKSVLTIPQTAVVNRNGKQVVFLVKNDKTIQTTVSIGRQLGTNVEIKSGLANGDRVVETVTDKIINGINVKVVE
ncbi:MAG: efflux RND transporter periplasmic adaptor subunit [Ignavibacteriaceae bacterium]